MKLKAGRQYKKDLSDIAGILMEHASGEIPLNENRSSLLLLTCMGQPKRFSNDAMQFLAHILQEENYKDVYETVLKEEAANRELLLDFQEVYPNTVHEENADNIIALLRKNSRDRNKAGVIMATMKESYRICIETSFGVVKTEARARIELFLVD